MKYLTLLFYFVPFCAVAQLNQGARYTALASAGVALKDNWAVVTNQAGLTAARRITAAINYEQRLLSSEVSTQSALILLPYKANVFGVSFQRYGFSAYNQQRTSLAYARSFGEALSAGIGFHYHQLRISNYGSAGAFSVDAGLQYTPNKSLTLGLHVTNASNNDFNTAIGGVIPVTVAFGAAFQFSDKVLLSTEIEKVMRQDLNLKAGVEYEPVHWFAFRGGISGSPFRQYAGLGIKYQGLGFDAAIVSEPILGVSPQIGLSYAF